MHDIEELKRQFDEARGALNTAKDRYNNRLSALRVAVIDRAEAIFALRGIHKGARVKCGSATGIYTGFKARDYRPDRPEIIVMAEKKDGTAHATAGARGFWDVNLDEIELADPAKASGE